jgi:serine protease DegQ
MRRLWLVFAQTVTIGLALWFIVATLKPDWAPRAGIGGGAQQVRLNNSNVPMQEAVVPPSLVP